jgi:O-antigen/teichoic acid export membrane protein
MSRVRTSLYWSFAENYLIIALQIVSSMVMARLLAPAEIGVFSVATVLVGLAYVLRDFGVVQYVVREPELDDAKLRAVLALSIGASWIMGLVVFSLSWAAGSLYNEPGVKHVMWLLTFNFFIIPFGALPMAMLRRNLEFSSLAKTRVLATVASTITGIGFASNGFSYMSPALGGLASTLTTILLANAMRPAGLPRRPAFAGMRQILQFSGHMTVASLVSELAKGAPELILGKVQNMTAVGFFGRATGLIDLSNKLVNQAINAVSLPYFSKVQREGGDLRRAFLNSQAHVSALTWPFFGVMATLAFPVVRLFYGAQWDASVPIVQVLCIAGAVTALSQFIPEVLVARGLSAAMMNMHLLANAVRVGAILLAAPFGLMNVALAMVAASLCNTLVMHAFLRKAFLVTWREILAALWRSAALTALTAMPAILAMAAYRWWGVGIWICFVTAVALTPPVWLAALFAVRHPLRQEVSIVMGKARGLFKRKPAG